MAVASPAENPIGIGQSPSPEPQAPAPASEPTREAQAPAAPQQQGGQSSESAPSADGASSGSEATSERDPVLSLEAREIIERHPGVKRYIDGAIGSATDLAVRRALAQSQADEKAKAERAELRRLRDDNPYEYAQRMAQKDEQDDAVSRVETAQQAVIRDHIGKLDNQIINLAAKLPLQVQEKLAGKNYFGDEYEARRSYLEDVIEELANHKTGELVKPEIAKARKEIEEAVRAEANGSRLHGNGSLNLGSGGGAPPEVCTQNEWNQNRSNREWRSANKARIDLGLSTGAIKS